VTLVKPEETEYPIQDLPVSQRDSLAACAAKVMVGSEGLPMGVQICTAPFEDELCLRVMSELETALPFVNSPPLKRMDDLF
jgi:Asp-tRNA(Asn)/Glu-tRNA(Gln) amidotransferase A subunit family amidase